MVKPHRVTSISIKEIERIIHSDKELKAFISESPVLLIINDAHRATPSYVITEPLLSITNNKIDRLAIATGTHNPPSEEELKLLVRGKAKNIPLLIHDAHKEITNYSMWGKTSRGTEVYLNQIIDAYDRILCINSVEPHYFAGYTGGVKSLIPGLAALPTVEKNHSWALDKGSAPCRTNGNPLYEDFWEAFELLESKKVYGIHLVMRGSEIIGLSKGKLKESQREAIKIADNVYTHFFENEVDRIVCFVEPPLNRSFYQSQKALENTRDILKKGGKILLVATCHEGIGNRAFYDTLKRIGGAREVINTLSRENYKFGDHKARKLAELADQATIYTTAHFNSEELETLFLQYLDISRIHEFIIEGVENNEKIVLCYDAGMNVLRLGI